MQKWIGKVAVITGASAGIGADLVKALANAGMIVVGLARRVEPIEGMPRIYIYANPDTRHARTLAFSESLYFFHAEHFYIHRRIEPHKIKKSTTYNAIAELSTQIIGNGKIYGKKCDVTVESDILSVFQWIKETLGGCDVFINIAGIIKAQFFIESDSKDFKDIFDLNIMATCICVREAIKNMRERGVKGHVIIMNSILGHRIPNVPIPLFSVYPASKFALTALSQTIRQELSYHKTNIKLTSISPGMVDTDFLKVYESYAILPKLNVEDVTAAVLYALGTPEYVQVEEIILQAMRRHNDSPQFEKKCIS